MTALPRPAVAQRVDKPWGHEVVFAARDGAYVGKALHVRAGEELSLQRHREKDETFAVQQGRLEVTYGWERAAMTTVVLEVGESLHVPPGLLHRMRALDDVVVLEASTAGPGWREDVERLEDRYGRSGTTSP